MAAQFAEVTEAFQVLRDGEWRRIYDREGHKGLAMLSSDELRRGRVAATEAQSIPAGLGRATHPVAPTFEGAFDYILANGDPAPGMTREDLQKLARSLRPSGPREDSSVRLNWWRRILTRLKSS